MNIPVDSASPESFLKQNLLPELKLRDPQLEILPMDMEIRAIYCCLNNDTIKKKSEKVYSEYSPMDGFQKKPHFLFALDTRETSLGNDNLPQIGIEIA